MSEDEINQKMDYEERSLPSRTITIWVGGLLLCLIAVMGLMYVIYGAPVARPRPDIVTKREMTQPLVQSNPRKDMRDFLAKQNEELSSYGWIDRANGVVRIPIGLAIERVLQRGLPAVKE